MFDTAQEITAVVTEKETDLGELRERMIGDFNLLTLQDNSDSRKGYESYTSSAPRNFFDKVLDGLNRAELEIQIRLPENSTEQDTNDASTGELFLFGAFNEIDRVLLASGEPPLRESLGWFMAARGWWALRALVYVPKGEKDTVYDAQSWDPLHTTWESGSKGLIWAAYKTVISKAEANAEYPDFVFHGRELTKIDFYDTKRNSVIINGQFVKDPTDHDIGHVPVQIGAVGSMPTLQPSITETESSEIGSFLKYRGDSVWTASRNLYMPHNKYVSTLMDIQKRATTGSLVHASEDGTKKVKGDPYESYQVIPVVFGKETIERLELPQAPPETAAILGLINADIQQSTLPYPLAYGGTQEELSGRALHALADATKSIYSPRTGGMSRAFNWLSEELIAQFSSKIKKSSELRGYQADGTFFQITVESTNLNPKWFVDVRVEPRMPRDVESEIQQALAITSPRPDGSEPLGSVLYARENILHMRNPHAESQRVLAEQGQALPPIKVRRIARALKEKGMDDVAEEVLALLGKGAGQPPGQGAPIGQPAPNEAVTAPPSPIQPPEPELPPEIAGLLQEIVKVLVEAGKQQMAKELVAAVEAKGMPTPDLLEAIITVLVETGQEGLARALMQLFGLLPGPGSEPSGPPPGSTPGPPPSVVPGPVPPGVPQPPIGPPPGPQGPI
jgi:hypothetical protein